MVFVCLNSSSILLFLDSIFFSFRSFSDKHRDFRAVHLHGDLTNFFDFFLIFQEKKWGFTHVSNNPHQVCAFIIWSFDRLIYLIHWSFDPFDPKIYAVSLFGLYIFFSLILFFFLFMFWFSEEEMEEVRDRFFFLHSFRGQTTTAKFRAKRIFFATKQFF